MSGIVAAESMWRHFMVWGEKKRGGGVLGRENDLAED